MSSFDFQFPPENEGMWRSLDPPARDAWLTAARDLHFERAEAGNYPTREPGRTVVIDGTDIDGLSAFFCAIGEAVNGLGGYFGAWLIGFDDCLFGGFGLESPYTIVWRNSAHARRHLGSDVLRDWLTGCKDYDWPIDEIATSWAEDADTMFDVLVNAVASVPKRGKVDGRIVLE